MMHIDRSFEEPARKIAMLDEVDVLVCGGGPGGIGAAIAAARLGARTAIIERFGCFGGTWTSGILSVILPYPFVKGVFNDVILGLEKMGEWRAWGAKYGEGGTYDSEALKMVLDGLIVDSGSTPYFFATVAGVVRENNQVKGVIVESKQGRQVIWAKQVIDASGDGDVCSLAGVPFEVGRKSDGAIQPMTMVFKMDNIESELVEAYQKTDQFFEKAWKAAKERGEVTIPRENVLCARNPRDGQWNFNVSRILGKDGTKIRDVTEATIEGRRQVAEAVRFLKKNIPGFKKAVLSETAAHIGVRETRRICCDYTITANDIIGVLPFEDCIARGNWFIDIHSPTGSGTEMIHPPEGSWYEIPYRSIRAQGVDNLLIASRCLDATHEAHAAIRITPQMVAVGQGAGTAAALCVKLGLNSTRDLDSKILRETLRSQGAFV